jgi:phosphate transport system permease protein
MNERKTTRAQKWNSYKKNPLSLTLRILVILSAVITVGVLLLLIGYILIKGIPYLKPSLFAWNYTTQNVSMMPAIINTIIMTAFSCYSGSLACFSYIFSEYAKREINSIGIRY